MSKETISTTKAPGAIGPYSQGVKSGNLVFTSGQLPINSDGELISDCIKKATAQALENVIAVVEAAGSSADKILKLTVFMKDLADFNDMNEVYATFFKEDCPARSAFQVAKLPKDAIIEIEAIASM